MFNDDLTFYRASFLLYRAVLFVVPTAILTHRLNSVPEQKE